MRRLYVVVAQTTTIQAEAAVRGVVARYVSHFRLAPDVWLIAAGGDLAAYKREFQSAVGKQGAVFVAQVGVATAEGAWPSLSAWLPRQLAAT
jgi:hypothetical protein